MALSVNAERVRQYLSGHQDELMPLQTIADACGVKKRSAGRIIRRLILGGYIEATSARGVYVRGFRIPGSVHRTKDEVIADLTQQVAVLRCKDIENNAKIEALTAALVIAQTPSKESSHAPLSGSSVEPEGKQQGTTGEASWKQSGTTGDLVEKFRSVFGVTVEVAPMDAALLAGMEKMLGMRAAGKLPEVRNPEAYLKKIVESLPKTSVCPGVTTNTRQPALIPVNETPSYQAIEIINREWDNLPDEEREKYYEQATQRSKEAGVICRPKLQGKSLFVQGHRLSKLVLKC